MNDTTFSPLTVYSGCTLSTGMPHSIAEKPRLYPNPTPGRFTVEFADPLLADSYYSLFDTMGKLLLQRPLPTGATLEEVDLTRFGAGSYVIKFTSPDGVCYERVVVE
ncbi:MAG: T9SS type A sorting domain-containing protein [Flavobacteriales bacterium]|nr:T9SS type A sorting domain-containing protein [Flavobacteriales bacterium]